jgi:DNA-binding IclR family transcriptional regulator
MSGITLVGVPLLDAQGKINYTLVAAGLSDQLNAATVQQLAQHLLKEARQLETLLSPVR